MGAPGALLGAQRTSKVVRRQGYALGRRVLRAECRVPSTETNRFVVVLLTPHASDRQAQRPSLPHMPLQQLGTGLFGAQPRAVLPALTQQQPFWQVSAAPPVPQSLASVQTPLSSEQELQVQLARMNASPNPQVSTH